MDEDAFWNQFKRQTQVFTALVYASVGFTCVVPFYHLHALAGSRNLHDRIFRQLLKGAMSFFDTTPMGQILSRFSADLDIVDTMLPQTSEQCFNLLSMCYQHNTYLHRHHMVSDSHDPPGRDLRLLPYIFAMLSAR